MIDEKLKFRKRCESEKRDLRIGKLEEAVWLLIRETFIVLPEVGYKTVCVLSSMDI